MSCTHGTIPLQVPSVDVDALVAMRVALINAVHEVEEEVQVFFWSGLPSLRKRTLTPVRFDRQKSAWT